MWECGRLEVETPRGGEVRDGLTYPPPVQSQRFNTGQPGGLAATPEPGAFPPTLPVQLLGHTFPGSSAYPAGATVDRVWAATPGRGPGYRSPVWKGTPEGRAHGVERQRLAQGGPGRDTPSQLASVDSREEQFLEGHAQPQILIIAAIFLECQRCARCRANLFIQCLASSPHG